MGEFYRTFQEIFGLLKTNSDGVDPFTAMMQTVLDAALNSDTFTALFEVLVPVGLVLCIVYFMLDFMERSISFNFSTDSIIFQFTKLIFALAVITNLPSLITGFNEFTQLINQEITEVISANASEESGINFMNHLIESNNNTLMAEGEQNTADPANAMGFFDSSVIFVLTVLLQISILTLAIKRAVKIAVKSIFSPIVAADLYKNGMNSSGIKFLKNLLGDFMQSTIVLLIIELTSIVLRSNERLADSGSTVIGLGDILGTICIGMTVIAMVKKSEDYTEKIFL